VMQRHARDGDVEGLVRRELLELERSEERAGRRVGVDRRDIVTVGGEGHGELAAAATDLDHARRIRDEAANKAMKRGRPPPAHRLSLARQ
jgi:hypothetical protein